MNNNIQEIKDYIYKALLAQRAYILTAAMVSTAFKNPDDFKNIDIHQTLADSLNMAYGLGGELANKFGLTLPDDVEMLENASTEAIKASPDYIEFDLNKLAEL